MLIWILAVIGLLALLCSGPWWGYSRSWGYGPLGTILFILVLLVLLSFVFGHPVPGAGIESPATDAIVQRPGDYDD